MVPMQVAHPVVTDSIRPVVNQFHNFDALGAVKFVQCVCISNRERDKAALRVGRTFSQEYLRVVELNARKCRRIAPCKGCHET